MVAAALDVAHHEEGDMVQPLLRIILGKRAADGVPVVALAPVTGTVASLLLTMTLPRRPTALTPHVP